MNLINISNHPSTKWTDEQKEAAKQFGEGIADIPFPNVPPACDDGVIADMVGEVLAQLFALEKDSFDTLHVMGEQGLTYALVKACIYAGWKVVHSTTERIVVEDAQKLKISQFRFVRFRRY